MGTPEIGTLDEYILHLETECNAARLARKHAEQMRDRTRKVLARVRETLVPRPMSEAPLDGTTIIGFYRTMYGEPVSFITWRGGNAWRGHNSVVWHPEYWIPLPDTLERKIDIE